MFTQIFGLYSGLVYIKTGSIWPAIALHSQCNFFGFPSFKNFYDRRFRMTDRIVAGALYVLGLVLFFVYFSRVFDDPTPRWWNE
jgi:prenyl protein peptidase